MSVIGVFVILLVAVFAIIAYFGEPSEADKRTRERLAALGRPSNEELQEGIVREVLFSRIALVDRLLRNNRIALKLRLMLGQANLSWTVGRFFLYSALMTITGGILGSWWIHLPVFGWLTGLLLGLLPLGWVMYKRSARVHKLNMMLPEAVALISRGLRAGYALPNSFVMVAEEMDDPLGPEFRRTADELNYGLPFREALSNLADRWPVQDLKFLVTAMLIQKETGGNLVELLDKIAAVLRARIQFAQKVRVHTAQGRLSGAILVAMPFALFFILNLIRPGYSDPLFDSEGGRKAVYIALFGMGIGILTIRKIVNIRV
jgi:tight adherence protein B